MEFEIKMDPQFNAASKCWLCPEPAHSKGRWSEVLDEKVAESICTLLWLDTASYLEFFKVASYCGTCQETVLQIDTLIRTVRRIKARLLQYRTKLSGAFLLNLDDISPVADTIDPIDGDDDPIFQPEEAKIQDDGRPNSSVLVVPPPEEIHPNLKIKIDREQNLSPPVFVNIKDEPSALQSRPTNSADANEVQLDPPEEAFETESVIQNSEEMLPETISESSAEPFPPAQQQARRITRSSYQKPNISYREPVSGSESDSDNQSDDPDYVTDLSDPDVESNGAEASLFVDNTVLPNDLTKYISAGARNGRSKAAKLSEDQCRPKEDGKIHCFHDNCTKSYLRVADLRTHIYWSHTERTPEENALMNRFSCQESGCTFSTRSRLVLEAHVYKDHQNDPLPYKCAKCEKAFKKHCGLFIHNQKLHGPNKSECRPRGRPRWQPDRNTADIGPIPSDKPEISTVNPEVASELRTMLLRKSESAAKSDSVTSEARRLRTTRKRKLQATETEVSSEEDSYEEESDGSSSRTRTRNRNTGSTGKAKNWHFKMDKLTIEVKTTQKDGKYHCFHGSCTTASLYLAYMKKHILTEHPEPLLQDDSENIFLCRASDCSFSSETAMELYDHFKEVHESSPIVKTKVTLTEEQMQRKKDGRVHCFHENCSKSYLEARELKRHIYKCHTERTPEEDAKINRFPCKEPNCSFFSRSSFALQVHMYKVHQNDPLPYKCVPCNKNYAKHDLLIVHNNAHHRLKKFVCHLCGKQNARKSQLEGHMRKSHKNEEGFKCSVCFQKFFFKEDCEKHEQKHVPGGPLTCLVMRCHRIFEKQEALRLHVVEAHYETQEVYCEQCGVSFGDAHRLRLHLRTHSGVFEFPCTDCDKKFRSKQLQRSHFETVHAVNGGQVYPCKLCEKTFHCRSYLYKHNAWHKHGVNANKPLKLQKKVLESSDEDEDS